MNNIVKYAIIIAAGALFGAVAVIGSSHGASIELVNYNITYPNDWLIYRESANNVKLFPPGDPYLYDFDIELVEYCAFLEDDHSFEDILTTNQTLDMGYVIVHWYNACAEFPFGIRVSGYFNPHHFERQVPVMEELIRNITYLKNSS